MIDPWNKCINYGVFKKSRTSWQIKIRFEDISNQAANIQKVLCVEKLVKNQKFSKMAYLGGCHILSRCATTRWDIGFFICSRCNFKRLTLYLRQSRVYQKANFDADGDNQDRYSYSENWSNRKLISDVIEENKFLELSKKRVWTFRNASSTFRVGKSIGLLEFFRLWKSLFRVD